MNTTTRRKLCICVILILYGACFAFWWLRRPAGVGLAQKETDATVSRLETVIKSQNATVERILTGARKEVAANNAKIREDVSALSPDAVAVELMALLGQYRLERDSGN